MGDDEREMGGEAPCMMPLLDERGQIRAGGCLADRIRIKRIYEPPDDADGYRVLVDRLWPRGVSRDATRLDAWQRDLAPSAELRRWFNHDPARWDEFRARYRAELVAEPLQGLLDDLVARAVRGTVTLLFGARDTARNDAVVLRDVLVERAGAT